MMTSSLGVLIQSLVLIVFINRYVAGMFLRLVKGKNWDRTVDDYEPSVTIVIPMFNEGPAIQETLRTLLAQEYPADKLSITVMDDCSTDDSYELAQEVARASGGRIRVIRNQTNMGKRRSINRAVRETSAEIIISVDSDVVVEPQAVRQLVRRFTSDRIAAVGGRVDVRNKHDNWLTRMQTVKYHYGYHFMKNLEWAFQRVMCLSGCLTAYRRSVLIELEPKLEHREVCGVPIKYGEDRFLTRQIIKAGYLTTMTLDAVCRTTVPNHLGQYFAQQLRWRRSNIVDYIGGMSHVWRLNPLIAVHFFSLFALVIVYPVLIVISIRDGFFFKGMLLHIAVVALFGAAYRWHSRKEAPEHRVSAFAFLPMSIVMPVTYALLTPVALFTLDSTSWETRGHEPEVVPEPQVVPLPLAEVSPANDLDLDDEPVRQMELPAA